VDIAELIVARCLKRARFNTYSPLRRLVIAVPSALWHCFRLVSGGPFDYTGVIAHPLLESFVQRVARRVRRKQIRERRGAKAVNRFGLARNRYPAVLRSTGPAGLPCLSFQ
jgi:hypothetical protein